MTRRVRACEGEKCSREHFFGVTRRVRACEELNHANQRDLNRGREVDAGFSRIYGPSEVAA